jgi:hypothetical protein
LRVTRGKVKLSSNPCHRQAERTCRNMAARGAEFCSPGLLIVHDATDTLFLNYQRASSRLHRYIGLCFHCFPRCVSITSRASVNAEFWHVSCTGTALWIAAHAGHGVGASSLDSEPPPHTSRLPLSSLSFRPPVKRSLLENSISAERVRRPGGLLFIENHAS